MKPAAKRTTTAVAAAVIAIGGAALALERVTGPAFPTWIGAAYAQEHTGGPGGSGGESGGGHTGGESGGSGHGSGGSEGGHGGGSGGMGGGHDSGSEHGGEESKGHGTRYQHQGHASGEHGHASSHQAGGDHFGGGSGLRGNDQVPEGVGRYGAGFSTLEASDQGRFRYWGGWYVPEEPVFVNPTSLSSTDAASMSSSEMIPGPGGGPAVNVRSTLDESARCEGVASGMPAGRQFSGANLLRLNTARGLVDPALAASGKIGSPYLMANLQSELTKPQPNSELAGTYLGLLAKVPVSLDTVKKIGFQLCAVVGDAQAKEIAQVAEQQRAALSAASGAMGGADHGKPQ